VNLDSTLPDDAQIVVHELPDDPYRCVSLKDVLSLNREVEKRLVASLGLSDDDLDVADKFEQAFATYDFSLITLTREDIDSAIEVFTRINTGDSVLRLFEIMVAKTYDEEKKLDMQVEWLKVQSDLEEVGYDGVSPSTILQLLGLVLAGEAKRGARCCPTRPPWPAPSPGYTHRRCRREHHLAERTSVRSSRHTPPP
jgi:hypothetical protein